MNINSTLKDDVLEQLKYDSNVIADDIFVTVVNGTVILDGTVPAYPFKAAASKSIAHMYGVLEVVNNLVIRLTEAHSRSDSDIRDEAVNAIQIITTVPIESVAVTVHNGWLKLEGSVENRGQNEAIEMAVRHLAGLVGITNLIAVKPLESQSDVGNAIETAFERHAMLDARKIDVATFGTTVVLSGSASNMAAKAQAERAAWSAKGVKNVENEIVVVS